MTEPKTPEYWSSVLIEIRKTKSWNQTELAKALGVSRETVSRWELGLKYPTLENQIRIGELASSLNVASVFGITQIVNISPFPMILTDRDGFVLAASKSSGFTAGRTVIDQTPPEERESFKNFSERVSSTGIWEKSGNSVEYAVEIGDERRKAVIQSVGSRGHIFALVQKL